MVLSAFRRFLPQNPGLIQKLKVPKWVCRSPLAVREAAKPFRAIFGPARGQIYWKKAEKIQKIMVLAPLGLVTLVRKPNF